MKKKSLFLLLSLCVFVAGVNAQKVVFEDFENSENKFYLNAGVMGEVSQGYTANPSKTGINTSEGVLVFTVTQPLTIGYAGYWFGLSAEKAALVKPQDTRYMHVKYYRTSEELALKMKLENSSAGGPNKELASLYTSTKVNVWEDLVFDFNGCVGPYNTLTIMPFQNTGIPAETKIYIDDIVFSNDPNPFMLFEEAAPFNVQCNNLTSTEATISWLAMEEAQSYKVYNKGTEIASSATNMVVLKKLTPATEYSITVKGVNEAGALSAESETVVFTTMKANKLAVPTGFVNMEKTKHPTDDLDSYPLGYYYRPDRQQDKVRLEWNAVYKADKYKVFKNGEEIAEVTDTKYEVTGLDPFTVYSFEVQAFNEQGEISDKTAKLYAQTAETKEQRDKRMAWWREARFGMMVTWGVHSVFAGDYHGVRADKHLDDNGELVGQYSEWIMFGQAIPVEEYRDAARHFLEVDNYDPDAWMKMAADAGMKYLVFISKHHDGFALWDSEASDWNVADATPYKKDAMRELIDAARRYGLRVGIYYSQCLDWVNEGGLGWKPQINYAPYFGRYPKEVEDKYVREVCAPQIKELLTEYGDVDIFWWDMGTSDMSLENEQLMLGAIYESGQADHIILNNRLRFDGSTTSDFDTPEQSIPGVPATGYADGHDWETCMTLNHNWGYSKYDDMWKSPQDVIQKLLDITSKGGNFLLGIGPKADGDFPEMSKEILGKIKDYMTINAEAIHGTSPCPLPNGVPYGRVTSKVNGNETTLYVHVFEQDWPADGELVVKGLYNTPKSVELLKGNQALKFQTGDLGLIVNIPVENPGEYSTTVKIVIEGALYIKDTPVVQAVDGTLTLTPLDAILAEESGICKEMKEGIMSLGCWSGDLTKNNVKWYVKMNTPGTYTVKGDIACFDSGSFRFTMGNNAASTVTFRGTGGWDPANFKLQDLGQVNIQETGLQYVELAPIVEGWNALGMRNVVLVPEESTGLLGLQADGMNVVSGDRCIEIQFTLLESAEVTIRLYDIQGQMLDTYSDVQMEQGRHTLSFDNLQPGIVILSAIINGQLITRKAVVSGLMD